MMTFHRPKFTAWRRFFWACLLSTPMLVACAKSAPVAVHGVNYSGETFSYYVVDPIDEKNKGGGELIEPYAAGGTTCCYELPKKWQAGIKVVIHATHWLKKTADGNLPEVVETHVVEVPQYPNGKTEELWVLRAADGTMSIVLSDFQPDHPKWPGRVKGWPVPSLAYQRERWDLLISLAESDVETDKVLRRQFLIEPDQRAAAAWNVLKQHLPGELTGYTGPADSRFRIRLQQEDEKRMKRSLLQLQQLQEQRP